MTLLHGYVSLVDEYVHGAELVADGNLTEPLFRVDDVADFEETSGWLVVKDYVTGDDIVAEYLSTDDDDSTILLEWPPGPFPVETRVDVWDLEDQTRVITWDVTVEGDLPTDGTVKVTLTHDLIDKLGVGIRQLQGASVDVEVNDATGEARLIEVRGKTPSVDGSFINPITLPNPTIPTEAPTVSPAVTTTGLPNTIMLVTEPIEATTVLTYEASSDYDPDTLTGAWAAFPDMPTRSTIHLAESLPDGEPFALNESGDPVVYWFRCVASNVVGAAAPSAPVAGARNLSAVEIVAARVIAEQVITALLQATQVYIGGDNFRMSADGGLIIERTDGNVTRLPADAGPNELVDVIARSIVITDGLALTGDSTVGGNVRITAQPEDPTEYPYVTAVYDSVTLARSNTYGLCRSSQGDGWVSVTLANGTGYLHRFNEAGIRIGGGTIENAAAIGGLACVPGGKYYVSKRRSSGQWVVDRFLPDFTPNGVFISGGAIFAPDRIYSFDSATGLSTALIDGVQYICWYCPGYTGTSPYVVASREANYSVGVTLAWDLPDTGVVYGLHVDNAATRVVVQPYADDVHVRHTTAPYARIPAEEWPRPEGNQMRGLTYWSGDPQGAAFWVLNTTGRVVRINPDGWDEENQWGYTWVDSDTHTTELSPLAVHTRVRGANIAINAAAAPQEAAPGTHVANRISIYAFPAGAETPADGRRQSGGPLAVGTRDLIVKTIDTGGATAPSSNNWSAVAAPGRVYSSGADSAGPLWDLKGSGAARIGPLVTDTNGDFDGPTGILRLFQIESTNTANIANNTFTSVVGWTTPVLDGDLAWMFSAYSSGVFTVGRSGLYMLKAGVGFANNTTGRRILAFHINGTEYDRVDAGSGGLSHPSLATMASLVVGDTLQIRVLQTSGGTLALNASPSHIFQATRLGSI